MLFDPYSALTLSVDTVMVMMDGVQKKHHFFYFACKVTAFTSNLPNFSPRNLEILMISPKKQAEHTH
jgi:hypothetical protein